MTDLLSLVEPVRRLIPATATAGRHPMDVLLASSGGEVTELMRRVPSLVDGALGGAAGTAAVRRLTGAGTDAAEVLRLSAEVEEVAAAGVEATERAAVDIALIVEECLRQIMVSVVAAPLSPAAPAAALQIACTHLARAQERLNLLGTELGALVERVDAADGALPAVPVAPPDVGEPAVPRDTPPPGSQASEVGGAGETAGGTAGAPSPQAAAAVEAATSALGTPYVWGGTTPGAGMDCSGLTQWAYAQAGVDIPRTADQQAVGTRVDADQLAPGDLVVWDGHVAMVTGDGQMIEAGDPVQINPVRTENVGMGFLGFYRPTA